MRDERFSERSHALIEKKMRRALMKRANQTASNRELAKELLVDEKTVRQWKARLGIPPLKPGTGEVPKPARKRNR